MIIEITYNGKEYSIDLPCTIEEITEFVLSGNAIDFGILYQSDLEYSEILEIRKQIIYRWLLSNPFLIENYCYTTGEDHFLFMINRNSSFIMGVTVDYKYNRVVKMIKNRVKNYSPAELKRSN